MAEDAAGTPVPETDEARVRVRFVGGESLPILFVNHIFVRATQDGYVLSFAQSHGPYDVQLTPEALAERGLEAQIIARLAVPPGRLDQFIEVLLRIRANRPKEAEEAEAGEP